MDHTEGAYEGETVPRYERIELDVPDEYSSSTDGEMEHEPSFWKGMAVYGMMMLAIGGAASALNYCSTGIEEQEQHVETVQEQTGSEDDEPPDGTFAHFRDINGYTTEVDRGLPWTDDTELEYAVEENVDRLLFSYRDALKDEFSRVSRYRKFINDAAERTGQDPGFIMSYIAVESGGRMEVTSSAGAAGPAQFMERTAAAMGLESDRFIDERMSPEAIYASARYYEKLKEQFGRKDLALAAYNWGPDNLQDAIDSHGRSWSTINDHLPDETSDYVIKALSREKILENKREIGLHYIKMPSLKDQLARTEDYRLGEDETVWEVAKRFDVTLDSIESLNPHVRDLDRVRPDTRLNLPRK